MILLREAWWIAPLLILLLLLGYLTVTVEIIEIEQAPQVEPDVPYCDGWAEPFCGDFWTASNRRLPRECWRILQRGQDSSTSWTGIPLDDPPQWQGGAVCWQGDCLAGGEITVTREGC